MPRTKGLSPKAVLAFCFPAIASIGGAITTWIVTGHLDEEAVRVAAGGLVTSALAFLGSYLGAPGETVEDPVFDFGLGYTTSSGGGVQPIMGGTMTSGENQDDPRDDEDGDDALPAELEQRDTDVPQVPDEIDQPDAGVK